MIPFSPPRIDQAIIDEVVDTLKSGWITTGPKTKRFEKELTAYTGCKTTLCVNSATFGMEMVLRWFGVSEGDEVIVPSYTYCATANVVVHTGAKVVMVDVDPKTMLMDVEALENAISPVTKAIIPVDVAGLPCDYEDILQLVERKKDLFQPRTEEQRKLERILVMADAAHSLGATSGGKRSGSLTDISVFSFHAVKNLSTAEGGAICFNLPDAFDHEEIYKKLNTRILHGQSKDALAKTQAGGWKYDVVEAGFKGNMTDIQASMGLVELARYEEDTLARRKDICARYDEAFSKHDWAELPTLRTGEKETSYHLYPLRINGASEEQRDRIIQHISENGVAVNVHFQPLPMLSVYKGMGFEIADHPNAYEAYSRVITLPVFYDLTPAMQDQVVQAVEAAVQSVMTA